MREAGDERRKGGVATTGYVLGVMGAAGVGKSHLCRYLKQEYGALVFDADEICRSLSEQAAYVACILQQFEGVGDGKGGVCRKALRELVFHNSSARTRLEQILYPELKIKASAFVAEIRATGALGVIDAALLTRAGLDRLCDRVIHVHLPDALRERRLLSRPGMTPALIKSLNEAQRDVLLCHNSQHILVEGSLSGSALAVALDKVLSFR